MTSSLVKLFKNLLPEKLCDTLEPCPFPPPYRSMLAINSDVEWTSWKTQLALLEAFAANNLETAFSFWMFAAPGMTWHLFDENSRLTPEAAAAFELGRMGVLDTLHAFGGRKHFGGCHHYDRQTIRRAFQILSDEAFFPVVYTNHGSTEDRQNIGGRSWATYQEGDVPDSDLYNLDLTLNAGVRYFWCDPDYVTDRVHLIPAVAGSAKKIKAGWGKHDALFILDCGRDKNPFLRFRRFMGTLQTGPALGNLAKQVDQVLTRPGGGYTVLFQHLGVERLPDGRPGPAGPNLRDDALGALQRLSAAQAKGDVLVTGTSRLLNHAALMTARPWRIEAGNADINVAFDDVMQLGPVDIPLDWDLLAGWTLPLPTDTPVRASLRGERRTLDNFYANGRLYTGFPWSRLDLDAALEKARQLTPASMLT